MKKLIQYFFGLLNLELRRRIPQNTDGNVHYNAEMRMGLERISKLNLTINTIVDVGAAEGLWSISASHFWPEANFILFEPLNERLDTLAALVKSRNRFYFVPAAAGKSKGETSFIITDDLDGSLVGNGSLSNSRTVQVVSIQDEIEEHKLKGPFLIKLDTHGFETPILEGCKSILDNTSVFIIECYGFNITKDSLLFWQMCQYMDSIGFRLWDVVDIMHRPIDEAFWQCDAFFIKKDSELFKNISYK